MPAVPVVGRRMLLDGCCCCSSRTPTTTEVNAKPLSRCRRWRACCCGRHGRRLDGFQAFHIELLLRWLHGGTTARIVSSLCLNVYWRSRNYCWGFIGFINASRIFRLCNVNGIVFAHISQLYKNYMYLNYNFIFQQDRESFVFSVLTLLASSCAVLWPFSQDNVQLLHSTLTHCTMGDFYVMLRLSFIYILPLSTL